MCTFGMNINVEPQNSESLMNAILKTSDCNLENNG